MGNKASVLSSLISSYLVGLCLNKYRLSMNLAQFDTRCMQGSVLHKMMQVCDKFMWTREGSGSICKEF